MDTNASEMRRLRAIVQLGFELDVRTGLRIGGSDSSIAIGGAENPIIRDPITSQPYIPGSSLKGKMRSLLERVRGLPQNWGIDRERVRIHVCEDRGAYESCDICQLFGIAAPRQRWFCLTRLRFDDVRLTDDSAAKLEAADTDVPYTEVKWEAAIDRITSAAVPRSVERIPAGARFGPGRIALFLYDGDDVGSRLDVLVQGLDLVEADYLGGMGARGSGRVAFENFEITALHFPDGATRTDHRQLGETLAGVSQLRAAREAIVAWASQR